MLGASARCGARVVLAVSQNLASWLTRICGWHAGRCCLLTRRCAVVGRQRRSRRYAHAGNMRCARCALRRPTSVRMGRRAVGSDLSPAASVTQIMCPVLSSAVGRWPGSRAPCVLTYYSVCSPLTLVPAQRVRHHSFPFSSWDAGKQRVSSLFSRPSPFATSRPTLTQARSLRSACPQVLAGRRLALSRVHPPPGDGSAPRARLLRMTSSQCTPLVQRCRYTQAWCRAVVGELRRRALSVATSLPAVSSLGGAHERSGSPRRGRAVHFAGGCASSIFCRWLQCHCSATVLRARVAPVAGRGQHDLLVMAGESRAARWYAGGAAASRSGSPDLVG